jgi:hypothetical protein
MGLLVLTITKLLRQREDGSIQLFERRHQRRGRRVETRDKIAFLCTTRRANANPPGPRHNRNKGLGFPNFLMLKYFFSASHLLRLTLQRGGDGTAYGIIAMSDTGSDILTLFDTDMPYLGNIQAYNSWRGNITTRNASGTIHVYREILVEAQLVRNDNTPWSDWISEYAIVRPAGPGITRLSGVGIRDILYFGTAPSNHSLTVAATKGGMASLL